MKHTDRINFRIQTFGEGIGAANAFIADVQIEGVAGYNIGLPSTGDRKTDVIALLRRIAEVMEEGRH